MTQKEIDKFLANTKVYVDGKSREIQEKIFSFGFHWLIGNQVSHTEKPFLYLKENKEITYGDDMKCFTGHEYFEISPKEILSLELDEPKYRPFKNIEECWDEMLKHQPFGWVKGVSGICYNIAMLDKSTVYFCNSTQWFYEYSLKNHFFMDGTPFGIKE